MDYEPSETRATGASRFATTHWSVVLTAACNRDTLAQNAQKTVQREVRPVYHKKDDWIRSHVFICLLAYYLQWHATQRLKPLFEKDGQSKTRIGRSSLRTLTPTRSPWLNQSVQAMPVFLMAVLLVKTGLRACLKTQSDRRVGASGLQRTVRISMPCKLAPLTGRAFKQALAAHTGQELSKMLPFAL